MNEALDIFLKHFIERLKFVVGMAISENENSKVKKGRVYDNWSKVTIEYSDGKIMNCNFLMESKENIFQKLWDELFDIIQKEYEIRKNWMPDLIPKEVIFSYDGSNLLKCTFINKKPKNTQKIRCFKKIYSFFKDSLDNQFGIFEVESYEGDKSGNYNKHEKCSTSYLGIVLNITVYGRDLK